MTKEVKESRPLSGFVDFVREQGVVGLAVGVVVGVAVKDTVDSIVAGLVNPLIGLVLPNVEALSEKTATISGSEFAWGRVLLSIINLLIIGAVVYFVLKALRLDKLDKK